MDAQPEVDDIVKEFKGFETEVWTSNAKLELFYGVEGKMADQYFGFYPTGVMVTGVTQYHPLVKKGREYLEQHNVSDANDNGTEILLEDSALWSVADRGSKAKVRKFKEHILCTVRIQDTVFTINHPFNTALLNFNPRLQSDPRLLITRSQWDGHVAVLSANDRTIKRMKSHLLSVRQYSVVRSIAISELLR